MNLNDEYERRMQEIGEKLSDPAIAKEIDDFLVRLSVTFNCEFRLMYDVYPESDNYQELVDNKEITLPSEYPTMKLGEFIDHINKEDREFNVYIDPIYLGKGVNAIGNVLTTTVKENMIIIPVSYKNKTT